MQKITITQGEAPSLLLIAANAGIAFDITGATIVTKFLKSDGSNELTIANGSHTITSGVQGRFTVALTAAETAQLKTGAGLTFVSIVTLSAKNYYFWGRKSLTVYPPEIVNQ